jgi:uncharacterized membrane protein YkgB
MKSFLKKVFLMVGQSLFRYGLGIILIWLGIMKFKNSEALQIEQAMAQTALFKWMLKYVTIYAFSQIIAWIQIAAGVLIMLKPVSSSLSRWGGAMAMVVFLAGILVFFTSGIVWQTGYGFPELSRAGHAFLKDFILFGAAAWCFSDSL